MIGFGAPEWLLSLLLVPVGAALIARAASRRRALFRRLADTEFEAPLLGGRAGAGRTRESALILLAVVLIGLALARPQFGFRTEVTRSKGIDLVIGLDLSRSMLAEDLAPSRLERAKIEIRSLVERLEGHRVGLVGYNSVAHPLSPLTVDGHHVLLQLERITADTLPAGGTSIGVGIERAIALMQAAPARSESAEVPDRAIVMFTDGEDHQGTGAAAAQRALADGIEVHVVGLGSTEGEPIPELQSGRRVGYVKDASGRTVLTRLDPNSVRRVADAGGGVAALPGPGGGLGMNAIVDRIERMKTAQSEARTRRIYEERYRWVLWPGIFALVLSLLLRPSRAAPLALALLAFVGPARAQTPEGGAGPAERAQALLYREIPEAARGAEALRADDAASALEHYEAGIERMGPRPELLLGRGLARAGAGESEAAMQDLEEAARASDPSIASAARFAVGNALRRAGDLDGAIESYKDALRADPSRDDARRNLELTRAMKRQQPESESGQGDDSGESQEDDGGEQQNDGEQQEGDSEQPKDGQEPQEDQSGGEDGSKQEPEQSGGEEEASEAGQEASEEQEQASGAEDGAKDPQSEGEAPSPGEGEPRDGEPAGDAAGAQGATEGEANGETARERILRSLEAQERDLQRRRTLRDLRSDGRVQKPW